MNRAPEQNRAARAAVILVLAALVLAPWAAPAAGAPPQTRIDRVLSRFPARGPDEKDALCVEIMTMGPAAIDEICERVLPPGAGDDATAEYALNALAVHVTRTGAERERLVYAAALVKALRRARDRENAAFFISQLQLAGRAEAVKPLAACLDDDRLADPAARALLAIGTEAAGKALRKSLGKAAGARRVTLIQALGEIRAAGAVKTLLKDADAADAAIRDAARFALANIGDPAADEALSRVPVTASAYERARAPSLYLLFARRLLKAGRTTQGLRACRALLASHGGSHESGVAASALALIAGTLKDKSLPDLLAAAAGPDPVSRGQALVLAETIGGPEATQAWLDLLGKLDPEAGAAVLGMLGRRGDPAAEPVILEALDSPETPLRLAAIPLAARLRPETTLPRLIAWLEADDAAIRTAARDALLGFPGDAVVPEVVRVFSAASEPARAAILGILGEKAARQHLGLVYVQMAGESEAIRTAALEALETMADGNDLPRLAETLLSLGSPREKQLAQNAIVAAARRIRDPERRADGLIEFLAGTDTSRQAEILRLLPRIGGERALLTVIAETRSSDPQVRGVAVYALAQWPDQAAMPELLDILRTTDSRRDRLTAQEGYIRLLERSPAGEREKLARLAELFTLPGESADRRPVLRALAGFRSMESFLGLAGRLDDAALRLDAARAMFEIASTQAAGETWLSAHQPIALLRRAAAALTDEEERSRAERTIAERLIQGGFVPLFDGRTLKGWKGLAADPVKRAAMSPEALAAAQAEADASMKAHWRVEDAVLVFDGAGESLCTARDYGDFELLADWKIGPKGDSGLYLRGSPQVQIWDPDENPEGSGGLYNNQKNPAKPSVRADRPMGQWNTFRVIMIGERVTVYLNDVLVADNVVMENYWERDKPIYETGQIELQAHGNPLWFRNVYIREIPRDPKIGGPAPAARAKRGPTPAGAGMPAILTPEEREEGFVPLFNGLDLAGWTGDTQGYAAENGKIVIHPERGSGNLYTERDYEDFVLRFEFKLTPGANNGVGVRTPPEGDAAYAGLEIQVLEDSSPIYWELRPYQYHGSVYGIAPARRGFLKPPGDWNAEEIRVEDRRVRVTLNGTVILDADLDAATAGGTLDGREHPGLARAAGRIGFLGHGSPLEFRTIRIKELPKGH